MANIVGRQNMFDSNITQIMVMFMAFTSQNLPPHSKDMTLPTQWTYNKDHK